MTTIRATTCLVALLLAACGDKTETSETAAAKSAIAAATGSIVGATTGMGVSTDDLPAFAELPPGAKAIHNMKFNSEGKIGGSLSLEVDQQPAELIAFYKKVFERHSMTIGVETQSADMAMLNGASADQKQMLNIMINNTENGKAALNIVHSRDSR